MTCHEIADYFIWHARRTEDPLNLLKLNGLLYFAQVWYVAFEGKFLFEEDFCAWMTGPIIPEVWERFEADKNDLTGIEVQQPILHSDIEGHLSGIIDGFWCYDSDSMQHMAQKEEPWKDARAVAELEGSHIVIPKDQIKQHYTAIMSYTGAADILDSRFAPVLEDIVKSAKEALEMPSYMKDMCLWLIIKKAERALRGEIEETE